VRTEAGQDNTVAIVAIAVSGGVSFAIALLAAYAAGRRQNRALKSEGRRQAEQLTAERERLTEQLAHDRELNDLEGVRRLLDECMAWIAEMGARAVQAEEVLEDNRSSQALSAPAAEALERDLEPAWLARPGGAHLYARLGLRFPRDSAIPREFQAWYLSVNTMLEVVRDTGPQDPVAALDQTAALRQDSVAVLLRFQAAAREIAGPHLSR
jgi:hypothetical protein